MTDRVTLKESVGRAISQGRTDTKIAALARAGKLGILLWHVRYGGEPERATEALHLLTRRSAKRLRLRHVGEGKMEYMTLRAACKQALLEWYYPECQVCYGVREISGEHKRVVCPYCNGTGVQNYRDEDRCDALKIPMSVYRKVWDTRFRVIHSTITASDAETGAKVREQLTQEEAHLEIEEEIA